MREKKVPGIYIVRDLIKSEKENSRLERLLTKFKSDHIEEIKSSDLPDLIKDNNWFLTNRTGKREKNPNIILSGFDWDDDFNNPDLINDSKFIKGKVRVADFRSGTELGERGIVCNSGYELHVADGCLFSCNYCHVGDALMVMLNIEEALLRIDRLMERRPEQKVFKLDNSTDLYTLEPELGASQLYVEHFSKTENHLLLFSKSDNVDHLLDLDHGGQTITGFTLSSEYSAKNYETGTPSLKQRIDSAKKCQDVGYHLRLRFSPIIPVKDWKDHSQDLIKKTFESLNPEVVSIEILCHMDQNAMNQYLRNPDLDPNASIDSSNIYELFDSEFRSEVYNFFSQEMKKYNPHSRRTLCLETEDVWNAVNNLSGTPEGFFCYCRGDVGPTPKLIQIGKK